MTCSPSTSRRATGAAVMLMLMLMLPLLSACSSTTSDQSGPTLERAGRHLIRYEGPQLEVLVSYTFAEANLGEPWLMLSLAITGNRRIAVEIKRENIFVHAPSGERIALTTQQELIEAYGEAGSVVRRAEVASEPLGFMGRDRYQQNLPFFITPKRALRGGAHADSFYVDSRVQFSGPLFFPVPAGVGAGPWVLEIELKERVVRIPFILGET